MKTLDKLNKIAQVFGGEVVLANYNNTTKRWYFEVKWPHTHNYKTAYHEKTYLDAVGAIQKSGGQINKYINENPHLHLGIDEVGALMDFHRKMIDFNIGSIFTCEKANKLDKAKALRNKNEQRQKKILAWREYLNKTWPK